MRGDCGITRGARRLLFAGAVLLISTSAGCAGSDSPSQVAQSPKEVFRALENRLLGAQAIRVNYTITSTGAYPASLEGQFRMSQINVVNLESRGKFMGARMEMGFNSNGRRLTGGSGSGTFDIDTPAGLNEAILLGLTRMGLLHNLATLAVGAPPEHTDGTIREWLQVSELEIGEVVKRDGVSEMPLKFAVMTEGRRNAEATLWINQDTGIPIRREQTVFFGDLEMNVEEIYNTFTIE